MASQSEMDQIVGKAIFDKGFRAQLLKVPEEAADKIGICLTDPQAARIRGLDAEALDALAVLFKRTIDRGGPGQSLSFW